MQFSIGDIVVHPRHGAGRVAAVEQWRVAGQVRQYYVVEIPSEALTLHVPVNKAEEAGMRSAISPSGLGQVLSTLRSRPRQLPDDYKERQEQIDARVKARQILQLAGVVRDLTWHQARAHLTRKDADLLREVQALLAAEMALVSGVEISDSKDLIGSTLSAAVADVSH